ncbi:MAG: hypothetical protein R3Y61_06760 [Rikenellaceae bacterium]
MKKIRRALADRKQWWLNFTSSLAGTILGIALTFGVGTVVQSSNQMQRSNKILAYSLRNIDENLFYLEEALQSQRREDTLLKAVHRLYFQRDVMIDDDTLSMAFYELGKVVYDPFDNSAESMFSSSIDIWPTDENEVLISQIRDCFGIMRGAQKELEKCIEIREVLYSKVITNLSNVNPENPKEILSSLFNTEGYLYYVTMLESYTAILSQFHEMASDKLECAYDEFEKLGYRE